MRKVGLTTVGWLVLALVLAIVLACGVATSRVGAQEADPDARYTPSSRGVRPAVLERSEVEEIAAAVFGADLAPQVARVAYCESRHDRTARSAGFDRLFGYYAYVGLMQIESGLWGPLARELTGSGDLTDAEVNIRTAYAIWQDQGWSAWPACRWAR